MEANSQCLYLGGFSIFPVEPNEFCLRLVVPKHETYRSDWNTKIHMGCP